MIKRVYVVSPSSIRCISASAAKYTHTSYAKFDTLGSAVLEYLALNSDLNEEIIAQFMLEFLTSPLPNKELLRQQFGKENPTDTDIASAVLQYVRNHPGQGLAKDSQSDTSKSKSPEVAPMWGGKLWYNPAKDFYTTTLSLKKVRKDTLVAYWSPTNTKAYYPLEEWSSNFVPVDATYLPPLDKELQFTAVDTRLVKLRSIYTCSGQLWASYIFVGFPAHQHKMQIHLHNFLEELDSKGHEQPLANNRKKELQPESLESPAAPTSSTQDKSTLQLSEPLPNSEWYLKCNSIDSHVSVISNSMGYTIVHSETEEPPVRSIPTDLFLRLYTPKASA